MPIIELTCRLISPFHTAGERYSNVHVCAPYILGSTLRGAVLGQIIQRRCEGEHFDRLVVCNPGYHADCPGPCGAKPLFDRAQTRFSFGEFDDEARTRIFRSRVAIDRATFSVAEGALLQLDAVPGSRQGGENGDGSRFAFEVEVPSPDLVGLVREAAEWAGEMGIGAFRNQGYGRFVIENHCAAAAPCPVEGWPADEVRLVVKTPYVLGDTSFGREGFLRDAARACGQEWCEAHLGDVSVAHVALGYIGRWCYEDGKRHVRAVALPGSALRVEVKQPVSPDDAQRLRRGIGDWEDVGFGRWEVGGPGGE